MNVGNAFFEFETPSAALFSSDLVTATINHVGNVESRISFIAHVIVAAQRRLRGKGS